MVEPSGERSRESHVPEAVSIGTSLEGPSPWGLVTSQEVGVGGVAGAGGAGGTGAGLGTG